MSVSVIRNKWSFDKISAHQSLTNLEDLIASQYPAQRCLVTTNPRHNFRIPLTFPCSAQLPIAAAMDGLVSSSVKLDSEIVDVVLAGKSTTLEECTILLWKDMMSRWSCHAGFRGRANTHRIDFSALAKYLDSSSPGAVDDGGHHDGVDDFLAGIEGMV